MFKSRVTTKVANSIRRKWRPTKCQSKMEREASAASGYDEGIKTTEHQAKTENTYADVEAVQNNEAAIQELQHQAKTENTYTDVETLQSNEAEIQETHHQAEPASRSLVEMGDPTIPVSHSDVPFLMLPHDIHLRVVDFLDIVTLNNFRATCRTLWNVPTNHQLQTALLQLERDVAECSARFGLLQNTAFSYELGPFRRINWWKWFARQEHLPYNFAGQSRLTLFEGVDLIFPCYTCLKVKAASAFSGDQACSSPPNCTGMPLRYCLDCAFDTDLADKVWPTWARQSTSGRQFIRCSKCHTRDEYDGRHVHSDRDTLLGFNEADLGLCRDNRCVRGHRRVVESFGRRTQASPHVGRMLDGSLCRSCFSEENKDWISLKDQLQKDIQASMAYLEWMNYCDDKRFMIVRQHGLNYDDSRFSVPPAGEINGRQLSLEPATLRVVESLKNAP